MTNEPEGFPTRPQSDSAGADPTTQAVRSIGTRFRPDDKTAEARGGLGRSAWGFIFLLWGYTIYRLGVFWQRYEDYNYGWFVPLLCLCLFWERWKRRPRRDPVRAASGTFLVLGLCALALLPATLFLTVITHGRFAPWLFAFSVVAISIITLYFVGGRSYARFFIFPVCFLLVAVPWPSRVQLPLTGKLATWNAALSARVANHLGTPAVRSGVLIETGAGPVGVDDACSGIRSFQASLMVGLFLGELFRFGFFRRLLLLFGGGSIAFLSNVVRTTYLVVMCDRKGVDAVNLYHDRAGFVILGITLAGLLLLAWGLGRRRKEDGGAEKMEDGELKTEVVCGRREEPEEKGAESLRITPLPQLRAALAAVLVWILAVEAGIEIWFSPLGKQAVPQAQWTFTPPSRSPEFHQLPISQHIRDNLRFDEGSSAEWRDVAGRPWKYYYLCWHPAGSAYGAISADAQQWGHGEICLISAGMILQHSLPSQFITVHGVGIAFSAQKYLSRGRNFHVFNAHWKAGMTGLESVPQLDTSKFGFRLVWQALRTRDRGRGEQRVIQVGVWEMESDEAASIAFKEYLEQMVAREGGEKAEVRGQK